MRIALNAIALALVFAGCGGGPAVTDAPPVFYPPVPETPRLQFLAKYSTEHDIAPAQGGFESFVMGKQEELELLKPYGVAIHDGRILVTDTVANDLWVLDLKAKTIKRLGGDQRSPLRKPVNIAVDRDGLRYITDVKTKQVLVFDAEDRFIRSLGADQQWTPSGVALDGDRLYVTDVKGGRVLVLDKHTGEKLQVIGHKGSGVGALFQPTNVAVGADGAVYVADTGNFRVLKFSPEGEQLQQFGKVGRNLGQFSRPKGLAVDRDGRVYVSDSAFDNVQIFDPKGQVLLFFGTSGSAPGALNLPAAISIDYDNVDYFKDRVAPGYSIEYLVFVVSQYGPSKINVFGFLKTPAGKPSPAEKPAAASPPGQ